MPLHDDEMNIRREKREAQRRKQEAERKRLKVLLVVAVLILGLCAWGITRLSRNAEETRSAAAETTEATTEATTEPEETTAARSTTTTIHIKAAGDLNVTDSVITAGLSSTGYDYTRAFMDVASTLADADLTLLNLEGNIYGTEYGTATVSAPRELLDGLRSAGVDLLQTANSCAISNGLIGMTSTLRAIRTAGMEPVGSFASQAEFDEAKGYTIVTIQGVRVAFVAFTKGIGGMGMPAGNEDLVNLLYEDYESTYKTVDTAGITAILKNVEAEKPDITIALLHWGSEYNDDVSSTQKSIVSLMQKRGVDVIIGTHPHTVQTVEFDEAAGTLIAYSLGDFFGDASHGGTNYSIILDLEITKDTNTGATKVTGYDYTPIYTVKEDECDGYRRVVRINEAIEAYDGNYLDKVTATCYSNMVYALQRITDRVSGKG